MFLEQASGSQTHYDVGTYVYSAPETKTKGYIYNEKADIYSLGTVLILKIYRICLLFNLSGIIYFEMCHGPFKTQMERYKILEKIRLPAIHMSKNFTTWQHISRIRQLLNHNPEERPTAKMILNQIPPSVENIKQFYEKVDKNYVSKQIVSIYLRKFTRRECVHEDNVTFHRQMDPGKSTSFSHSLIKASLLPSYIMKLTRIMNNLNAYFFSVALFLPKSRAFFNVSTPVCLLNDKSANVYAIPEDRRYTNDIYYCCSCRFFQSRIY